MTAPQRPRVLLADDHLMVAEALKSLLAAEFELGGVVEDGRGLLERAVPMLAPMKPSPAPAWAEISARNATYGGAIAKMLGKRTVQDSGHTSLPRAGMWRYALS